MEFDDRFRPALVSAIAADPSVERFAVSWPGPPLLNRARPASGAPAGEPGIRSTDYRLVSSDYFDVFGIPMVSGRAFSAAEAASRAAVAILSESAARDLWPGGNAIGQILQLTPDRGSTDTDEPVLTSRTFVVVGVARQVHGHPMGHPEAGVYLPMPITTPHASVLLRVKGDTDVARRAILGRLTAIDPNIGMVLMMRSAMKIGTYPLQVVFWVVVALGSVALILTMSGIFATLSYLVVQRTKDIGIRMALGATTSGVTREVLWQALRMVIIGLAAGVGLAAAIATILTAIIPPASPDGGSMGSRLVGVINPFDSAAYVGSVSLIILASTLSALVPAVRASRTDPIATLRHD
jgi:hypothetical protein